MPSQEVNNISTKDLYIFFIRALQDEEVLDEHYDSLLALKATTNCFVVLDTIDSFFGDTEQAIADLTNYLEEPVVNYAKMTDPIHLLRKSSEGVGGCGVVLASFGLQYACRDKNKERCLEIFKVLKDEHHILVNNLHTLYQMEKTVLAEEEKAAFEEEEEKAALEEEEESDLSDDSKGGL